MKAKTPLLAVAAVAAGLAVLSADRGAPPEPVGFNRDIRPIMSDTCFLCHGFDAGTREGGLRLDIREEALKAGDSGLPAIVPGKPEKSEIIARIFSDDPDDVMPAAKSHKTLTPAQKALFRRWVAEGAPYEPHWAYTPLNPGKVPPVPEGGNAIDGYVGAKLAAKGIRPSPEAPRERLLRRLSLDLTGLPPTPEETTAFLADDKPGAYERQVDRLLASPRFGERMAVWWLDVARFADTVGFHGDQNQRIFPYRDYVIAAFNANKPFDTFTREQLAGDLLPNPTPETRVASGYNRLNMMTREGGAQPGEYLAKYGAERVRSVSVAWLGSTFGCAECHDHKFDPIPARDFYTLKAFFADVKQWGVYSSYNYSPEPELAGFSNDHPFPPEIQVDSPYLARRAARLRAELEASLAAAVAKDAALEAEFSRWQGRLRAFLVAHPSGWAEPAARAVSVAAPKPDPKAKSFPRLELKPGEFSLGAVSLTLPPGVAKPGARLSLKPSFHVRSADGKERRLAVSHAEADTKVFRYSQGHEQLGIPETWTLVMPDKVAARAVFLLAARTELTATDTLVVDLESDLAVRVALSPLAGPEPLRVGPAPASPEAARAAFAYARLAGSESARSVIQSIREARDGKAWTMVTQPTTPLPVRVLARGNWQDESGELVLPATPSFLPGFRASTSQRRLTRLDLADWIVSRENPITARTVMNRLWAAFLGSGLSATLDDLGSQGEPPSHPELLDWLASEFRDKGWDTKRMVRLIVTSRTYRQSSHHRSELRDIDPGNRLLAAQNPRRLEAEFVRDNALAIAGLLNVRDIGGPSAKPYQPDGYYEPLQFPDRKYVASRDDEQWRRGLYMHWQRTFLHPMLANFDAPSRDECAAVRTVSNTPQQALTLLNDPTFVEAARVLAHRVARERDDTDGRLDRAFRLAVGRAPRPAELDGLRALLGRQLERYRAQPADAAKLLKVGLAPTPTDRPEELAAWTQVCRALLNTQEVVTRY
jgi:hypothetical protein